MCKAIDTNSNHTPFLCRLVKLTVIYGCFAGFVALFCCDELRYRETLGTFYYDQQILDQMEISGLWGWLSLFVTQLFARPWIGMTVTAALLTFLTWALSAMVLWLYQRLTGRKCRQKLTGKEGRPRPGNQLRYFRWIVPAVIAVALMTIIGVNIDRTDAERKRIAVACADGDWDAVMKLCQKADQNDVWVQNCRNLALAERGRLAADMLHYQCSGPEALIMRQQSPEAFTVLSDVYYSIGLISAAQFYAFQANEAYGDLSPRLLKRLIDTNIIYGQYAVARKYIDILSHTLFYRDWAEERRTLLGDDQAVAAHPELGPKRTCLFDDNRFIAQRGLDDDMWQILSANPQHQTTLQYLGCFYILAKDLPRFMQMLDRLYAQNALPERLPVLFQQAVCTAALASGTTVDQRYGIPPQMVDACYDFWSNRRQQPGTAWHYLLYSKM